MSKEMKRIAKRTAPSGARISPVQRKLSREVRSAFEKAADGAMAIMGYVVAQEGEWVVKKYADGRQERLTRI
ncbi:hypothetical protein SAMN05444008_12024 [Cnuella takakiae]|uniref:Uncharacterized protein n=1 Tax=Cnuella takakiae TaxID=1302690 RepID=A0A1M5HR66_9BACT|nr:hypothetical protein [Cnuella takakiae]SHG18461.1 hypothetical protein SAMN05444008_12024 [Cnuella takakiae]